MSLLNDHEVDGHVEVDTNIWNNNGGKPKAARKNIRLILKSGKVQLSAKHTAFEKSSSSSSSEAESPSDNKNNKKELRSKQQEQLEVRKQQKQETFVGKTTEDINESVDGGFLKENPGTNNNDKTGPENTADNSEVSGKVDCTANMDSVHVSSQLTVEHTEEFKVTSSTDLDPPELKPENSDLGATSAIEAIKSSYGENSPTESDHCCDVTKDAKVGRSLSQSDDVLQGVDKYSGEKIEFLRKVSPDILRDFQKWYDRRRGSSNSIRDSKYERYRDRSRERMHKYRERERSRSRDRRSYRDRSRSRSKERRRDRWRSRSRSRDYSRDRRRERMRSKDRYRERERSRDRDYRSNSRERERRNSRERRKYTSVRKIARNREGEMSSSTGELKTDSKSSSVSEQTAVTNAVNLMVEQKRPIRYRSNSSTSSGSSSSTKSSSSRRSPKREIQSKSDRKLIFKKLPNPDEVLKMRSSPKVENKVPDCDINTKEEANDNRKVSSSQVTPIQVASKENNPDVELAKTLSSTAGNAFKTSFNLGTSTEGLSRSITFSDWLFPSADSSKSQETETEPCSSTHSTIEPFKKGSSHAGLSSQMSSSKFNSSEVTIGQSSATLPTLPNANFTPSFIPVLPAEIGLPITALKTIKSPPKSIIPKSEFLATENNNCNTTECHDSISKGQSIGSTHGKESENNTEKSYGGCISIRALNNSDLGLKDRKSDVEFDVERYENKGGILSKEAETVESEKYESGNMENSRDNLGNSDFNMEIEDLDQQLLQQRKNLKISRAGKMRGKKRLLLRRSRKKLKSKDSGTKRNVQKRHYAGKKRPKRRRKVEKKKSKHKQKRKKLAIRRKRRRRYSTTSVSSSSCSCCSSSSVSSSSSTRSSSSSSSSFCSTCSSSSSSVDWSTSSYSSDSTSESSDESSIYQRRHRRRRRIKVKTKTRVRAASVIKSSVGSTSGIPNEEPVSEIPLEMKMSSRKKNDELGCEGDYDCMMDGDNMDDLILEMNLAETGPHSYLKLDDRPHRERDEDNLAEIREDISENTDAVDWESTQHNAAEKNSEEAQPNHCFQEKNTSKCFSNTDIFSNKLLQNDKYHKPVKHENLENEGKSFGGERLPTPEVAISHASLGVSSAIGENTPLPMGKGIPVVIERTGENGVLSSAASVCKGGETKNKDKHLSHSIHPKEELLTKPNRKDPLLHRPICDEDTQRSSVNSDTLNCIFGIPTATTTSHDSPGARQNDESNGSEPLPPGVDTVVTKTEPTTKEEASQNQNKANQLNAMNDSVTPEEKGTNKPSPEQNSAEKSVFVVQQIEKKNNQQQIDLYNFDSDSDNDLEKSMDDVEDGDLVPPGVDEADYWRTVLIESKTQIPRFTPSQVLKSANRTVENKRIQNETEVEGHKEEVGHEKPTDVSEAGCKSAASEILRQEPAIDVSKEIELAKQIASKVSRNKEDVDELGRVERIAGSSSNRTFNRHYMRGVTIYGYKKPYSRSRSRSRSRGRSRSRDRGRRGRKRSRSRSRDREYSRRRSYKEYSPSSPTDDGDEKIKGLKRDQGKRSKDNDKCTRSDYNGLGDKEPKDPNSVEKESSPRERDEERESKRRRSSEEDKHSRHHRSRRHPRDFESDRHRGKETDKCRASDRGNQRERSRSERRGSPRSRHRYHDKEDNR